MIVVTANDIDGQRVVRYLCAARPCIAGLDHASGSPLA
jgi:hypothetical protein